MFSGATCGSPVAFCNADSCNRRGNCRNIPGSGYKCDCFNGYEGTDCQVKVYNRVIDIAISSRKLDLLKSRSGSNECEARF